MANLPEVAQWEAGVYQLEVIDFVVGGPTGVSNRQAKELANRTAYLKQSVEAAQSDADAALTNAAAAQGTANTALENAATAQTTANAAQDNAASRVSKAGDIMTGDLDMTGHKIMFLPYPTDAHEPARKDQLDAVQADADAAQTAANNAQATADSKVAKAGDVITGGLEVQGGIRYSNTQPLMKKATIDIGAWDMDATVSIPVAHGIAGLLNKRHFVRVTIRTDDDSPGAGATTDLLRVGAGYFDVFPSDIVLTMTPGSIFDNGNYDKTAGGYNRGWIEIDYEA